MEGVVEFLVRQRKVVGMTQGEVAGRLGVSRALFGRWESGVCSPRLDQFEDWCDLMGFEVRLMIK